MIAYIKGNVESIGEDYVVIDNHGIGYRVFSPSSTLNQLQMKSEVKLYTYYHVREDAILLYGFKRESDRKIFVLLLGVSGIGPKAALGILSTLSPEDLQFAILSDDAKAICKAPGIGKKTAQKLILELKDKFNLEEAFEQKLDMTETSGSLVNSSSVQEAVEALAALGYSSTEALKAVQQVTNGEGLSTELLLKQALKYLL